MSGPRFFDLTVPSCSGASSASPSDGLCPPGARCPAGSVQPISCEPGTYSDSFGSDSCKPCLHGYYCIANTSSFENSICPAGYYCPNGTQYAIQFPCPAGSFGNVTGLSSLDECTPCPAGYYCQGLAATAVTGLCDPGYFCLGNCTTKDPTGGIMGNLCPVGTFCPEGSSFAHLCTGGKYCEAPGLSVENGECQAGFYCTSGASRPNATDGVTGNICPAGHYCPLGSTSPQRCPPGTFGPYIGNPNDTFCLPCLGGYYCNGSALSSVTAICPAGYFCPNGTIVPELQCPAGSSCTQGVSINEPCPPGTYQALVGHSGCQTCEAGYYCPGEGNDRMTNCPLGSYCLNGTRFATEYRCPNGTYGNFTNLVSSDECTACPPGMFCYGDLLIRPTPPCSPGFFCTLSAFSPTPIDGITGNICPIGHYCPPGTSVPVSCPVGTYAPDPRRATAAECLSCTPGMYCPDSALDTPTGPCSDGYYCLGGASFATPLGNVTGDICPQGSFCVNASTFPIECPAGTYNDRHGQSSCSSCPAGYYCLAGSTGFNSSACPAGSYCPQGTGDPHKYLCPIGSFGNATYLKSLSECSPCLAGSYCAYPGKSQPTDFCQAGYYCPRNSSIANPVVCPIGSFCPRGSPAPVPCTGGKYCEAPGLSVENGECQAGFYCTSGASRPNATDGVTGNICPAGHYCPLGSTSPQRCPPGTFGPYIGNPNDTFCLPCLGGYYCNGTGLTESGALCSVGYFCPNGTIVPESECWVGYSCPVGVSAPIPCDPGTYQSRSQQATCVLCPSGWICSSPATVSPSPCPAGSYCRNGTALASQYLCPNGTFGNQTGLTAISSCASCSPGMCCNGEGLSSPSGPCGEGYYCIRGAATKTPTDGITGNLCPPGRYCPEGSSEGKNCSVGTYNPSSGQAANSACLDCLGGYYCASEGLSTPTGSCAAGYYCQSGASTPTPSDSTGGVCPVGMYCPLHSPLPMSCLAGTYNDVMMQAACKICPAGFFCIANSTTYLSQPCPSGYYCPNGTTYGQEFPCPKGTFLNSTLAARGSDCMACTAGTFCGYEGLSDPSGLCQGGYYCSGGAQTDTPSGADSTGGRCSAGYFCPSGSGTPIPCTGGRYCERDGLTNETDLCLAGYYCILRASRPDPTDNVTGAICPPGYYCEKGRVGCFLLFLFILFVCIPRA